MQQSHGHLKRVLDDLRKNNHKIDLVILTHVDDDHIGGVLKAFEHPDYLSQMANRVLFNSGQLIHENFNESNISLNDISGNFDGNADTSISQGASFESFISRHGLWDRRLIYQSMVYELLDIKLTFLSPSDKYLRKLLVKWEKEEGLPETSTNNTDYKYSYAELLATDKFIEDKSIHNGSSLSFILERNGKNFVFLGDAFPSTIIEGLRVLGYSEENPLKAELVKISHHGSKKNTNSELLKLIDTTKYVVSTDGSRHGLPNKTTFARIHTINPEAHILFNYEHLIDEIYSTNEVKELNEKLQGINGGLTFE
ncbi:MBL fold metallo-hydrolase [Acinetobacter guillouiae]|uniref:MBL fold metallo-hydrolase n=1 Tax=Acinetobacter guillouiae TaxID=106649 RepID=UPI002FDB47C2